VMDVPGRLRTSLDATVHRLIAGVPRPRDSQQKSRDEEDGFFLKRQEVQGDSAQEM